MGIGMTGEPARQQTSSGDATYGAGSARAALREQAARSQAQISGTRQARHHAEAQAAEARGDSQTAAKHADLSASASAAAEFYKARGDLDDQLEAARKEWASRTAPMRLAAVQADALLRRRHPGTRMAPLRSAEPEPLPDELPEATQRGRQQYVTLVAGALAAFRAELETRAGVLVPDEDPDYEPEGEAWPDIRRPHRDAILQPPRPLMPAPGKQPEPELQA
jgi:hypothetical protein